jgi:hypothetical protein
VELESNASQIAIIFPIPDRELNDMAYHCCAQAADKGEALELYDMLQLSRGHARAARQEIRDHASGQCPPGGHHGRSC